MNDWMGSRSLASVTPSILDLLPSCPVVVLGHKHLEVLGQQDQSFHSPQSFIDDTDLGVAPLKALDLGLGGS